MICGTAGIGRCMAADRKKEIAGFGRMNTIKRFARTSG
jgi:hypothetical protein